MYSKKLLLVLIICIICLPIFLGAYTGIEGTKLITDTIIDEDFETGTMPGNWTVIDGAGDGYKWHVAATGASGDEPPACGSYYAFYDDDAAGWDFETIEYLLSPKCYTTNSESLKLQYGWGFTDYGSESLISQYRIFKSSTWGTWITIATYTGTSGSGTEIVDLTGELPCDSVQIQWIYDDNGEWAWNACVDNIILLKSIYVNNPTVKPIISKLFAYCRIPETKPTLQFSTTDADNDSIIYRIIIDTESNFTSADSFTTGLYASGDTVDFTFPFDLINSEAYWWKVKSNDPNGSGLWGPFSDIYNFTISTEIGINNCSWYQGRAEQFNNNLMSGLIINGDSILLTNNNILITDTILNEDFEAGIMPSDWTVIDGGNDGDKWHIVTETASYEPPDCGSYYAYFEHGESGLQTTEYLISPACYTTNSDSLKLQYGWGYMEWTGEEWISQYRIFKSGAWGTWITIATYNNSGSGTQIVNLTGQLPCDSVQIQWEFYNDDGWYCETAVDNVIIVKKKIQINSNGNIQTLGIAYNDLANTYTRTDWGNINWHQQSADDSLLFYVEYRDGGIWTLIPDIDLTGNAQGYRASSEYGDIDISGLNTGTYDTLRLYIEFIRDLTKSQAEPALLEFEIGNQSNDITQLKTEKYNEPINNTSLIYKLQTKESIMTDNNMFISFNIPQKSHVMVNVYNITGECIKTLVNKNLTNGQYRTVWYGKDDKNNIVSDGIYFIKMETENKVLNKKIVKLNRKDL